MTFGLPTHTDRTEDELRKLRPPLYKVSPLTVAICWLFVAVNMVIALSLVFIYAPARPISIITGFFSLTVWGLLFGALGLVGAYVLIRNHWEAIRLTLMLGLVVKCIWLLALIQRTIESPQSTILLTCIWFLFAGVQAATYIFFFPPLAHLNQKLHNQIGDEDNVK